MTRGALYRVRHVAVAMAVAALTDARLVEVGASSFEDEDGDTGILGQPSGQRQPSCSSTYRYA